MIRDLGRFIKEGTTISKRYAIYECPYCSKEFMACAYDVKNNKIKTCGCSTFVLVANAHYTHKMSRTKLHYVWLGIKARCNNKDNKSYKNYGARGISICNEWGNDFMAFYNWSIANGYKDGLTIDRIENDGNYEPSNCRFVTNIVNCNNKRLMLSSNTSGYSGVIKHGNYCWIFVYYGKLYSRYGFKTAKEAAIAKNDFIIKMGFDRKLNIID